VDVKFSIFFQDGGPEAVDLADDRLVAWLRRTVEAEENTQKEKNNTGHESAFSDRVVETGVKGITKPPFSCTSPYDSFAERLNCFVDEGKFKKWLAKPTFRNAIK
jgi:hypothetical protein